MGNIIPGLNYDSKLAVDDLAFSDTEIEKAILERFKYTFGTSSLNPARFGIVDVTDPRDLIETETTRPLIVYQSPNNSLLVNVAAGAAISASGAIIINETLVEDFELVRTLEDDIIVVFLENEIINSDPIRITRYNVAQPVRKVQNTEKLRSALLTDFNNAVLFTPQRKSNIVVLAIIKVANTTSGLELQFDYTNNTYAFNRPWFSAVDIEHRARIGTGIATDRNPHGTTFNDLVSGNLTLYAQLLKYGLIIARDDDVKGIPGKLCSETITVGRVLTDTGGGVTALSRFGGVGAKYIVLASYPTVISAFYLESHKGRAIAFDHIPGTRIIVLPDPEVLTGTAIINYNQVFAGMPPASVLSNTLTFGQPDIDNELIFSGGISLSELANPSIDFDGSGPVPRNYKIYINSDGTILRSPQLIQTPFKLDDLGTLLTPISFTIFGPSKLSIGLADALAVPAMSIVIRLFGTDLNGAAIQEDITFSGTTWTPVSLPGVETSTQFIKTNQIFYSITDIKVQSRVSDGPNSKIVLWAELETETTKALNQLALISQVNWDGLAVAIDNIKDLRYLVPSIPIPNHKYKAAAEFLGLGGTTKELVLSEDLHNPQYRDTTLGYQNATQATFSIFVDDYSLIVAGDQIAFPTGATLTAITSGSPNRTLGEYLAASSDQDTRDDMVLTINHGPFTSGIVAVADVLDTSKVNCTIVELGAPGNGTVSEPIQTNAAAITLSGNAIGGIDAFGECFTPRHQDYIESEIPSPATYAVYDIRERYLSRPIAITERPKLTVIVHDTEIPRSAVQVRIRVASSSDPTWLPWEVAVQDGAVFTKTYAFDVSKCQIEIFGKCGGFSLYEGDI